VYHIPLAQDKFDNVLSLYLEHSPISTFPRKKSSSQRVKSVAVINELIQILEKSTNWFFRSFVLINKNKNNVVEIKNTAVNATNNFNRFLVFFISE